MSEIVITVVVGFYVALAIALVLGGTHGAEMFLENVYWFLPWQK